MKDLVIYVHGKGGNADEALHYKSLFPDADVLGFDYKAETPWDAKKEFPVYFDSVAAGHDEVTLVANSIGAFFSMNALGDKPIKRAYFISPIVNMEKLICDMMTWTGVSEEELCEKKTVPTSFGETLSWEYLCYVRENFDLARNDARIRPENRCPLDRNEWWRTLVPHRRTNGLSGQVDYVKIENCLFFENIFLPRNWYSIARKKRVYIGIGKYSICLTGAVSFYG